MSAYYQNDHRCQYDYSSNTASNGCTWTSGANGIDASTGGKRKLSPDYVEDQVAPGEQTNPSTPGWSMQDLVLAMDRLGVGFEDQTGGTWDDVTSALEDGHYVVLQGDSDQFGNDTCSGNFNGDHAIGVHPKASGNRQRIDDPICTASRDEDRSVLRKYAEDFAKALGEYPGLRYGVFTAAVPGGEEEDMGTKYQPHGNPIGIAKTTKPVGIIPSHGGEFYDLAVGTDRHVFSEGVIGDGKYEGQPAYHVQIPGANIDGGWLLASACTFTRYASDDLDARDEQWRDWLLDGSPGS